jgi:hypothetical protein
MADKPGRNDLCHCGSGKKYKKCHLEQDDAAATAASTAAAAAAAAAAATGPVAAKPAAPTKQKVQPQGVSNRAPPPARRRSV